MDMNVFPVSQFRKLWLANKSILTCIDAAKIAEKQMRLGFLRHIGRLQEDHLGDAHIVRIDQLALVQLPARLS